jgi:hypothetical protein
MRGDLSREGFCVLADVLSEAELVALEAHVAGLAASGPGTRRLLELDWCCDLARRLEEHPTIRALLPTDPVAVQCTYFGKQADCNWLVALHRDLSVPVRRACAAPGWRGWSEKEGTVFAQPPRAVLEQMVAVRVHLEANTECNAPLLVVPGSHASEAVDGPRVACLVDRGGALVMRPLLLHASGKLESGERRVLHILFGPRHLPSPVEWAQTM